MLALVQPLLQLIRDHPEFLVVHRAQGTDLILLTATLSLVFPLVLSLVVWIIGLAGNRVGNLVQALVLGGLLGLTFLPVFDRFPWADGWLTVAMAGVGGAVMLVGYLGSRFIRGNLSVMALMIPAFLLLFFTAAPIRSLLVPDRDQEPALLESTANAAAVSAPVIMIVFDEFPTSSLLKSDGELDHDLFPGFCRLAGLSTWYPRATSISGATLRSVPAIMTGIKPEWRETPSLADHPNNLFTLLGHTHDISAVEVLTNLCPDELKSQPRPGTSARLEQMSSDLWVLYQHIVVPQVWRHRLISVADRWGGFQNDRSEHTGPVNGPTRLDHLSGFFDDLTLGDRPPLVVAHTLLPHVPFQFLPDGKIYNRRRKSPTQDGGFWGPDEIVGEHSFRRHLLQLVATDRLIDEILDRLDDLGILEDAAIVVTADHGVCFKPGLHRRRYCEGNEADLMFVPLFIKAPGQVSGKVDQAFIQSLDILPTLAGLLGCELGWEADGRNIAVSDPVREELLFLDQDQEEIRWFDRGILAQHEDLIAWKHGLYGSSGGVERLFTTFDPGGLMGRRVHDLSASPHPVLTGRVDETQDLKMVDLESNYVPAEINGIIIDHEGSSRLTLALALNGQVVGASRTYLDLNDDGHHRWQITVSPESFRHGANEVKLFLVDEERGSNEVWEIPLTIPSFIGRELAPARVPGVDDIGFYVSEHWDGIPMRWTNGQARWIIPIKKGERPKKLTVGIVSSGPPGAEITVLANGVQLLKQFLPRGAWDAQLPLAPVKIGEELTIEMISTTFVPAEVNPKSKDRRLLGAAVCNLSVK